MSASSANLTDILDDLDDSADGEEATVGDTMEAAGHRGSGVFILLPALIGASPVGMIPGVPTVVGIIVFLFAAQIAFGRERMWLPEFLRSRAVDADRLDRGIDKLRPIARRLDNWFGRRLESLTGDAARRGAAVIVMLVCLALPPLEVVPGAALLPLLAISVFGLALALRDGVLMLVAIAVTTAAAWGAWTMV